MDRKDFKDRPNYRRGNRNTMVMLTGNPNLLVLSEQGEYRVLFEN